MRAYTIGCAAPGTSGRNREAQIAESLNTTGAYSLVRHPLYLANAVMWLGPLLYPRQAWPAAVLALGFWLYYERIMFAEEEFLRGKYGQTFIEWAARTPAFLPNFRHWVPSNAPFNFRVVLRREYSGLLLLVLIFAALDALEWRVSYGEWHLDPVLGLDPGCRGGGVHRAPRAPPGDDPPGGPEARPRRVDPETKGPARRSRTGPDVVAGDAGVPSRLT